MIEITIYGRGGQGGVTLAKLIATVWFSRGKYAQAFGVYAAERSGAPIQAFVRIDDAEITSSNQIREPDHVIVLDPTLIGSGIVAGLEPAGGIILNTPHTPIDFDDLFAGRSVATIDATAIALRHGLGTRAVPIVNTTMMGAVARVFGFTFEEVRATFAELGFGGANLDAAREAFDRVTFERLPGAAAKPQVAPPQTRPVGLLDPEVGAPPKIRTGSWATRRPDRRTLTPPCNHSCPAGNDVQRFVQAIARASYTEALEVLLETSPLPGICGRVCPAPCMDACNRNEFDEGVNVRELERFAADHGDWPLARTRAARQRVAVVGSGPAGLSASYHLARLGYRVSLFEASDQLGGVLRNGIPEYRLPREVLDREIGFILMHGVTAYTDAHMDRAALRDLTRAYSAVFAATGLQESRSLDLGDAGGGIVRQGIDFLDCVHRGEEKVAGERVVVVGGGNTAIDAARSSRRLGAASVHILYRRSRAEMPAIAEEVDAALEEGVVLDELVLPQQIRRENNIAELTCTRMTLGEPDASGRRQPVRDNSPAAQFTIRCERVILALGQSADVSILPEGEEMRDDGQVIGVAGAPLFIGGDLGRSEGTVAAAIGSGRRAAWHIHRALSGLDLFEDEQPVATADIVRTRTFSRAPRERGRTIERELREHTFAEVHAGIEDAAREAQRCFSCGVCNSCDRCVTYCPEGVLTTDGESYTFNYDYCKGCGVCATECPRGVIVMSEIQ